MLRAANGQNDRLRVDCRLSILEIQLQTATLLQHAVQHVKLHHDRYNTDHISRINHYSSHITQHTPLFTLHTSHVTHHTSPITHHTPIITNHLALCQCMHINAAQPCNLQLQRAHLSLCSLLLLTHERIPGQEEENGGGGRVNLRFDVRGLGWDMGLSRAAETIKLALQR
jgi:hypothetical protein